MFARLAQLGVDIAGDPCARTAPMEASASTVLRGAQACGSLWPCWTPSFSSAMSLPQAFILTTSNGGNSSLKSFCP